MLRRNTGFTLVELVMVVILIAIIGFILLPAMEQAQRPHRASCANNLKQFGLSLLMYANESRGGQYPPLQVEVSGPNYINPDNLKAAKWDRFTYNFTPRIIAIYPEYLNDPKVLICQEDQDNRIREIFDLSCVLYDNTWDEGSLDPNITQGCMDVLDDSYVYFNWVFDKLERTDPVTSNPPALLKKSWKSAGQKINFLIKPQDKKESMWFPAQLAATLTAVQNQAWVYMDDTFAGINGAHAKFIDPWDDDMVLDATVIKNFDPKVSYGNLNTNTVYHLRNGIEKFLTTDTSPGGLAKAASEIPIVMDHPVTVKKKYSHSKTIGAHVLFIDGHVEFVQHNEKAPVNLGVGRIIQPIMDHDFRKGR